jgi:glucosamine-6-phosphate deaminase
MEVVVDSADRLARAAADVFERLLRSSPAPVLGLATGSTPLGVYDELVRRHREEGLSFAHARAFLLDEYVGLPPDHPERYAAVIKRVLVDRTDLPAAAVRAPDGSAPDLTTTCREYEHQIKAAGGIDVQILGLGTDGHVAFNEPGSSLTSRTRVKTLTDWTREANARFFADDVTSVPRHVLTQGLGTIMESDHLVMLATGAAKAEAVRQLVEGSVSVRWPATALQMHPHLTVLLDEEAASDLELRDYYAQIQTHKPAWQDM